MTEIEQFHHLRTWLLRVTRIPEIVRAHPDNGPRPPGEYGLLNLLRSQRINNPDDMQFEDLDGDDEPASEVLVQEWSWGWSFNGYGPHAVERLERVASATKSPAALLALHPLTLHDTSMIRRLPQQVNNVWEERAQIDLDVRGLVRIATPVGLVEEAPIRIGDPAIRLTTTTVRKP